MDFAPLMLCLYIFNQDFKETQFTYGPIGDVTIFIGNIM